MLNHDINSRFEDWLLNPTEALDFEVKGWLDMQSAEARATIAKALIALENHGGGFLLIGYTKGADGRLVPEEPRPASLDGYNVDEFNSIVKRFSEPVFHVDASLQAHPETGEHFPLVVVHGASKVPVRAERGSPENSIRKDIYYVRRSGPASEAPQSGAEWDALIRRCVTNQREEIVGLLRSFGFAGATAAAPPKLEPSQELTAFSADSFSRWSPLNDGLPPDHPAKISLGHFRFAAKLVGQPKGVRPGEVLQVLERGRRYTGWPAFVTLHQDETKPYLVDGALQAWTAKANYPDVGHADFWRVTPEGEFFLLRGYQEDTLDESKKMGDPGALFEATLPIWRLGEFLLRVAETGEQLFEEGFEIVVSCAWTGLAGRKLFVHSNRRYIPHYTTKQDEVQTSGKFPAQAVKDLLPDVVKSLTQPLYEYFELFTPPDSMYAEELAQMTKNTF